MTSCDSLAAQHRLQHVDLQEGEVLSSRYLQFYVLWMLQQHRKVLFLQMEIQTVNFQPFKVMTSDLVQELLAQAPSLIGAFSISQNQELCLSLSLFKNGLLLGDQFKNYHYLKLQFEIKLQILYFHEKKPTSEIIGIKLHSQGGESVCFFGYDSAQFAFALGKILNMKGFHQIFRPIKKLGKGNFATVYEAQRITDRQRFAVKAFSKQNTYSSKKGKQSLINELSLLRALNIKPHPNVLRLQAVYESQNSIYVILELLEGQTLLQIIQNKTTKHLASAEIKTIMEGLFKGLVHLVKNRVLHRDLKPENIMIRQNSRQPVIVDFGLATNCDLPEYLFFRCGTPGYVAPQIIVLTSSIHLEPTCDVFSLGSIFHLLLVNRPLFAGMKYDQVYKNNKELNFSLQTQHFRKVQPQALDLISKMLERSPGLRITPSQALEHPFFNEAGEEMKKGSLSIKSIDTSTAIEMDVSVEKQKKKKKFFFF